MHKGDPTKFMIPDEVLMIFGPPLVSVEPDRGGRYVNAEALKKMQFDLNINNTWIDWSNLSDELVQFVMDITPETMPLHQRWEFDIAKIACGPTCVRHMKLYYGTNFDTSKVMRMNWPEHPGMAREVRKEQAERMKREEEKRKKADQQTNRQDAGSTATFGYDENDPGGSR